MTEFKSLDIRGLSFFNAFNQTSKAFKDVKNNGMLELIFDKKKNFSDAFSDWANKKGHKVSDIDEKDNRMVRMFIKKASRKQKTIH